ncbi:RNA polymerase sigma factor [Sphingobacterium sp. HJSM2_6]|uniref:RNA polymerase sigma factor n=1 Tax=Sphingobacterium sp. HJSM2_6 TaxID=3366264 RepID=UPI003BE5B64C
MEDANSLYKDILLDVSSGNEKAFALLYDLFAEDLSKHILAKVGDMLTAEDILHDLFLSLWKNRKKLPEIKSLPAYLYSSCRYLILSYYRNKDKLSMSNLDIQNLDILNEDIPLEERMHYRYIIDIVNQEIENLPEKCREIFKLSRVDYLSNKEIAQRLAISESTIEKHINKAIKRLRLASKNLTIIL